MIYNIIYYSFIINHFGQISSLNSELQYLGYFWVPSNLYFISDIDLKWPRITSSIILAINKALNGIFVPVCRIHNDPRCKYKTAMLPISNEKKIEYWSQKLVLNFFRPIKTFFVIHYDKSRASFEVWRRQLR